MLAETAEGKYCLGPRSLLQFQGLGYNEGSRMVVNLVRECRPRVAISIWLALVERPMRLRSVPRAKGFTLVELLVVIAIIGILVALLLPACRRRGKRPTGCSAAAISSSSDWRSLTTKVHTLFCHSGRSANHPSGMVLGTTRGLYCYCPLSRSRPRTTCGILTFAPWMDRIRRPPACRSTCICVRATAPRGAGSAPN